MGSSCTGGPWVLGAPGVSEVPGLPGARTGSHFSTMHLLDWIVVLKRGMTYFLEFAGENDLLSLPTRVRIKTHFVLESPVSNSY